ncbi:MAG: hypothetical protein GF364_16380 [Candidatus Lokiarchaeota archaeon]|nr:hypothetical protein [Candidatus Lokiarchaeota archaeon]
MITMKSDRKIYELLKYMLKYSKIIQISGMAGLGKTTLAMTFVKIINSMNEIGNKSIYIDSEHKFSVGRFDKINYYDEKFTPKKVMNKSIFMVKPRNLFEQEKSIKKILLLNKGSTCAYDQINAIILDSASNFFRNEVYETNRTSYYMELQYFYEYHIFPLLNFQKKHDCIIIFIHQITENPKEGTKPTLHNLFSQVQSSWIHLKKEEDYNLMIINRGKEFQTVKYNIQHQGIQLINYLG